MKSSGVLHVIASMDPEKGGVGKAVRLIITGLEKHGIHNEVVTLDHPENNFCKGDLFKSFALGPMKSSWQYSKKLIPWFIENFKNYDVVILHGLWLYNGFALGKAFKMAKKKQRSDSRDGNKLPKLFVMPHGMLDPYFQKAARRKLKAIRNWIYWKLVEHKTIKNSTGLLFTCEQEKSLAKQSFSPYSPGLEIIVGLGVEDPPVFNAAMQLAFAQKCLSPLNAPFLLFLGRINEKKGIDLLIDAYIKICSVAPTYIPLNGGGLSNIDKIPALIIAGPGWKSSFGRKIKKKVFDNVVLKDKVFFYRHVIR